MSPISIENEVTSFSMPISNDKLFKIISDLSNKVEKLTDIVKYQTTLIQELKTDNININKLLNTEFKQNKDILKELPIKQLTKSLNKLGNDNSSTLIFTNFNKQDNIDYVDKDNLINFINNNLAYTLNKESIVNISKYTNASSLPNENDTNNITPKPDKYFIKLIDQNTTIDILKNKSKLSNSNYYITIKHSIETDHILYKARKLVKSNSIYKAWVYIDTIYIIIDKDKNNKLYISDISQLNNL